MRDCLITDDMVDTAGTLAGAVGALKDLGANKVYCCASHPLLSGPAVERLSNAPLTEMAVVNTIHVPEERRFGTLRVLSVAPLLSKAIRYIHSGESVSSLFEAQ